MATSFPPTTDIRTAVVTGRHPFDVPGFHAVLRNIPGVDCYPQHLNDFVADAGHVRADYHVVVFYNFHQPTPGTEDGWWASGAREALEALGETDQGIFILHHALLAYPEWPFWSDLCGIPDRSFSYHMGEHVHVDIADPDHPITQGLRPWTMVDETYGMSDPGEDSHVLLTTEHTKSMHALAWTRQHRNARVFCYQSGHGNRTYTNYSFRTVVARGIRWLAGRL